MDGKKTKKIGSIRPKKVIFIIVVCAIILSTLLIFCIPPWAVLVINSCEIVVYRIVFRKLQFSAIGGIMLYLIVGLLAAGVLVLIYCYLEQIYSEVLKNASETELFSYRDGFKISCLFFAIIYLLQGIWVVVDAVRTKDVIVPFHSIVPITLMGALMIYIWSSLFIWLLYVIGVYCVNTLCAVLCEEDGPENWGGGNVDGGGSSDVYDIYIVKH